MYDYELYRVTCSANGKLYIGITKAGTAKRFRDHCYLARSGRRGALYNAMRLHGVGAFSVETLAVGLAHDDAAAREIAAIASQNTRVPAGYNICAGGKGAQGHFPTDETRALMSAAHTRRQADPLLRARTSAALAGVPKSAAHVAAVSAALTGKRHSAETKAKIKAARAQQTIPPESYARAAEARRGVPMSEEAKANMSAAQRGKTKSEDHKRKISDALRGRKLAPEHIAASAAARRGVPKSEEWKAKLRTTLARKRAEKILAGQ